MSDPAQWHDIWTAEELAAALDVYAAQLAKKHGWYDIAGDIGHAADCIRDLSGAGARLVKQVMEDRGAA